MAKIDYMQLLELSEERIWQCLPKDYEIDDVGWGDEVFQINVFDAKFRPDKDGFSLPSKFVDRFRFYRRDGEAEEAVMDRWNRELEEFCERWKEVS